MTKIAINTIPSPKEMEMSFFSTGSKSYHSSSESTSLTLTDDCSFDKFITFLVEFQLPANYRRRDAMIENPGDYKSNPDNETKQADDIYHYNTSHTCGPELTYVSNHTNREET